MSKPPSKSKQRAILRAQDFCCFYCYRAFGSYSRLKGEPKRIRVHWDHQVPFAFTQSNSGYVASCQFCNLWKSSKVFDSAEQAREYLRKCWAREINYKKACEECQTPYEPTRPWQKYCTPKCQFRAWSRAHPRVPKDDVDTVQPV